MKLHQKTSFGIQAAAITPRINSTTAIILDELSSPSRVMKSLFLSENKLTEREMIIIMVIIDRKKAIDLIKTLKKIDISSDL